MICSTREVPERIMPATNTGRAESELPGYVPDSALRVYTRMRSST